MAIRPKIKTFGYATIIYGFSNLLTKIVAVTLIPLYTNYLSVYEVGIIALLEMIELFVVTFIPIGCVNAMWRYLPDSPSKDKNKIIITSFTLIIISGFLTVVLLFFFKSLIRSVRRNYLKYAHVFNTYIKIPVRPFNNISYSSYIS